MKSCCTPSGHFSRMLFLVVLSCVLLPCMASAYELSIYAPQQLQRGMPLIVNGTSNLPAGISIDVVLSETGYITEEVARETVTLQGSKNFTVVFDTTELSKGLYKLEVPGISGYAYLGDSITLRVVELLDRSDEVTLTSPRTQVMDGILELSGTIKGLKNAGVQIEVIGPGDIVVFGPEFIPTKTDSSFSKSVSITDAGEYEVSFTDSKGYIGKFIFTVEAKPAPTTIPTTIPVTSPPVSATAPATLEKPAYFAVTTGSEQVKVATSPGIDWVIEYADENGIIRKVNEKGQIQGEEVIFDGTGGVVFIKVYPYRLSDKGDVTLIAGGASSIAVSTQVPPLFAATATPTTKSPISPFVLFGGIALALALFIARNR